MNINNDSSSTDSIEYIKSPEASRRTVLCSGAFDVLHAGHLAYLTEAKSHGNYLIVAVTSDKFINKGPGRPYFNESTRAAMLSALKIVDQVEIIDDATALPAIEKFKPNFYVKGPDYKDNDADSTGNIKLEIALVEKYGGKVVYTEAPVHSSSTLVNRFFADRTEAHRQIIEQVNEIGGIKYIKQVMQDISKLTCLVIGEPIHDIYTFVEPQNLSSKYPCVSAKHKNTETYLGGSLAIENHLRSFCEVWDQEYDGKTPRKTRFISEDKAQRIFELTEINEKIRCIPFPKDADVTILADFGHGLFTPRLLADCEELNGFVALNVQTNSSNYGFNTFQKHKRWDYLVLDKRELQLAYHDNETPPIELGNRTARIHNKPCAVTLGSNGACYYANKTDYFGQFHSPAFADNVVDATGAGDAYFAITSLLVKVNANPVVIPFIGNVFAGLKTKIIGNKSSVSKMQLMKALESLLK